MSVPKLSFEAWQMWALTLTAKACVVLGMAMLASYLMRRRPAAERHLVWVAAVVGVLLLPLSMLSLPSMHLTLSVPSWLSDVVQPARPSIAPLPARHVKPSAMPAPHAHTQAAVPVVHATMIVPPRAVTQRAGAQPARMKPSVAPAAALTPPPTLPPTPTRSSAPAILFIIWCSGVLVGFCALLFGFARVHWYARAAGALTDPALLVRARGIAAELGVQRIRLLEGQADAMPMTFGVLRPTVLLPSVARTWTRSRQETVLRHELAHIRRRDALTQLAAELACVLHWFNPLVWFAARRLYVEREHACDDLVLMSGSRAADYAEELVDIARSMRVQRAAPLAAIAMARPSQLRLRIMAVLEDRQRRALLTNRLLVPAWVGTFVLVLPLSSVAPRLRWPSAARDHVTAPKEKHKPTGVWRKPALVTSNRRAPAQTGAPIAQNIAFGTATTPTVQQFASTGPRFAPTAPPSIAQVGPAFATGGVPLPATRALLTFPRNVPQEDCLSRTRNRSVNTNHDDERHTIKWSADDCSGEVVIDGDVQFDADFTRIVGLSRGGSIRISADEGGTERRLQIEPQNGGLAYEYSVNGRRAEFDAAGQAWLSNTMLFLFRRMGFMAQERATAILTRGGANAVLTEIGLLQGDYVRSKYLAVLVEKGRLDEGSLRRVLELAGNTLASDYYRTQVITAAAGQYEFTDGVRQAYIDAAARMGSDHYKHLAFETLLEKGNLSPAQVAGVLAAAGRISSDHYRAQLLTNTASRYTLAPEIRAAYLNAASGIRSDHYKVLALNELLGRELSAAELARVVDATTSVANDHYRAQLLTKVSAMNLTDATLQTAFVRAASAVKSDHYKADVLTRAVARPNLDGAALASIIDAATTISGDHYRAGLLVEIARRYRLEGELRERFLRAMDTIKSSHYQGQVATALLRQGRS